MASINGISMHEIRYTNPSRGIMGGYSGALWMDGERIGTFTFIKERDTFHSRDYAHSQRDPSADKKTMYELRDRINEYVNETTNLMNRHQSIKNMFFLDTLCQLTEAAQKYEMFLCEREAVPHTKNKKFVLLQYLQNLHMPNSSVSLCLGAIRTNISKEDNYKFTIDLDLKLAADMPSKYQAFDVVRVFRSLEEFDIKSSRYQKADDPCFEVVLVDDLSTCFS